MASTLDFAYPPYLSPETHPHYIPPGRRPDTSHLITENNEPVDSQWTDKQMRLLTESLEANWTAPGGVPFRAYSDVGLFFEPKNPAQVPDVMLAVDVEHLDLQDPDHRSYFIWVAGKVPDVVIELVFKFKLVR